MKVIVKITMFLSLITASFCTMQAGVHKEKNVKKRVLQAKKVGFWRSPYVKITGFVSAEGEVKASNGYILLSKEKYTDYLKKRRAKKMAERAEHLASAEAKAADDLELLVEMVICIKEKLLALDAEGQRLLARVYLRAYDEIEKFSKEAGEAGLREPQKRKLISQNLMVKSSHYLLSLGLRRDIVDLIVEEMKIISTLTTLELDFNDMLMFLERVTQASIERFGREVDNQVLIQEWIDREKATSVDGAAAALASFSFS